MRTKLLYVFWGVVLLSAPLRGKPQAPPDSSESAEGSSTGTKSATVLPTPSANNTNNNSNTTTNNTNTNTTSGAGNSGAANTTQSSGSNEDPGDGAPLPNDMSESLADFVLQTLKDKLNNLTGQRAQGQEASANADASPSKPANATTAGGASDKPTAADNDHGDGTVPEASKSANQTTEEPFSKDGQANCDAKVDLNNYCLVDDLVQEYFHLDMGTKGLRSPLFDMDIVQRLMGCPRRGQWCLGNQLDVFKRMLDRFYDGPLCEESMWECIFDVVIQRQACDDREFMFVVDTADLVCEMFEDPVVLESQKNCFAHVLAALHVTYADFLSGNMSDIVENETDRLCDGYKYRMTETYLCANRGCEAFVDATVAMKKFNRWGWFMDQANKVRNGCNTDDACGTLDDDSHATKTWFGMTTPGEWMTEGGTQQSPYPVDQGDHDRLSEEDATLMTALSIATAVGLMFMVLGLVFWRRNRRRGMYYYRAEGYGKLPAGDEAHLLSRTED